MTLFVFRGAKSQKWTFCDPVKGDDFVKSHQRAPSGLELRSLIDLAHCHRCRDKGVYYGNELVGAITRLEKRWYVWRIVDFGQPMDQAEQAMYEERMKQVADFDSLFDAREYVRGPFCKMIMEEFESRKE